MLDVITNPYATANFTELSDPASLQIDALFVRVQSLINQQSFIALNILNEMAAQLESPVSLAMFSNGRVVANPTAKALRVTADNIPTIVSRMARLSDADAKLLLSNALRLYVRTARDPILVMQISMQEPCLIASSDGDECYYGLQHSMVPFPASLLITPAYVGAPQLTSGSTLLSAFRFLRKS